MFDEKEEKTVEQVVSSYIKLIDYRKRLQGIDADILLASTDVAKDLVESEIFDRRCLEECDSLFRRIPPDHPLLTSFKPLHLTRTATNIAGGDQADKPKDVEDLFLSRPSVEKFDGKNTSWLIWRPISVKGAHENPEVPFEMKFFYLIQREEGYFRLQARDELCGNRERLRAGLERPE